MSGRGSFISSATLLAATTSLLLLASVSSRAGGSDEVTARQAGPLGPLGPFGPMMGVPPPLPPAGNNLQPVSMAKHSLPPGAQIPLGPPMPGSDEGK